MTTTSEQIAELKRRIEVMQAYERGEVCQVKLSYGEWCDLLPKGAGASQPMWDFDAMDYRIKPKKREVWLYRITNPHGSVDWHVAGGNVPGTIRFVEAD